MNDVTKSFTTFLRVNRSASNKTIAAYLKDITSFCNFFNKNMNNINSLKTIDNNDIKNWLIYRRNTVSNRTISRQIAAIKMFFIFLNEIYNVRNDFILNMNGLKFNSGLPKAVNYEQIKDIINNLDKLIKYKNSWELARDRLLFTILFSSGMRISEILSLKHEDFNKSEFVIFGKGGKERIIPMLDTVKLCYNFYKRQLLNINFPVENNNFIFINSKQKTLSARSVERTFQTIKINKNLQYFSPHVMRHSFASVLLENGANICQIQELLGHESLATTQKYTKITQKIISDKLKKINW